MPKTYTSSPIVKFKILYINLTRSGCEKSKEAKASLGERASGAVALARNEHRGLETRERRPRKAIGAKLDIIFKIGNNEYGSCEVSKHDVTVADDKYLDDGLIKLPKTLRNMMVVVVQNNPSKINDLLTVGFLVMSLCMELVVMDVPVGQNIARITKTARFEFPSLIETMAIDFLPLLEITWKANKLLLAGITTRRERQSIPNTRPQDADPFHHHHISNPRNLVGTSATSRITTQLFDSHNHIIGSLEDVQYLLLSNSAKIYLSYLFDKLNRVFRQFDSLQTPITLFVTGNIHQLDCIVTMNTKEVKMIGRKDIYRHSRLF
ncbi:MAG: hypothetical protein EXX96DRAFT_533968 [Benjaminiella poitrasii]|nr:MAG: hypothetical protein EXX96DRAFT_533968 [Benjaminiella poitrasii]